MKPVISHNTKMSEIFAHIRPLSKVHVMETGTRANDIN